MIVIVAACREFVASFTNMPKAWARMIAIADYNADPPMCDF
jgi:hypothetical protein